MSPKDMNFKRFQRVTRTISALALSSTCALTLSCCLPGCKTPWNKPDDTLALPEPPKPMETTAPTMLASAKSAAGPTLKVSGVQPQAGPVRVAMFADPSAFPKHEQADGKFAFESSAATVEGSLQVPAGGPFALAVYQDLNNDGQLNRSSFGMPTEPYGFSKNARGQYGPPTFADAQIASGSQNVLEISLQ